MGWYLRFSLSYRDVEQLLTERGLQITSWCGDRSSGMRPNCRAARRTKSRLRGRAHDPQKARRAKVKWVRRSVCSIALLLVSLDWKSDSLELSHPPPVRFQSCNTTAWSKEGVSYCASYVLSGISGWFSQFNASFHLFGTPNAVLRTKSSGKSRALGKSYLQ